MQKLLFKINIEQWWFLKVVGVVKMKACLGITWPPAINQTRLIKPDYSRMVESNMLIPAFLNLRTLSP